MHASLSETQIADSGMVSRNDCHILHVEVDQSRFVSGLWHPLSPLWSEERSFDLVIVQAYSSSRTQIAIAIGIILRNESAQAMRVPAVGRGFV
jgi:hypothetical protein